LNLGTLGTKIRQLRSDQVSRSKRRIAGAVPEDSRTEAQIKARKPGGTAQKRCNKPLPGGWLPAERMTVAMGRFNPANNLTVGDGSVIRRQRIAAGHEDLVGDPNDSVRRAWTDHREHAGPGDSQLHDSATARDVGHEIAAH
jgi:hypothetical protein